MSPLWATPTQAALVRFEAPQGSAVDPSGGLSEGCGVNSMTKDRAQRRQLMPDGAERVRCAFYTVANARHFIGVVALLNSLRLAGHTEPIRLMDAGLTDEQRTLLANH